MMSQTQKILLVVGILLLDSVIFFLPLSAVFLAYIILVNPRWFREFLNRQA